MAFFLAFNQLILLLIPSSNLCCYSNYFASFTFIFQLLALKLFYLFLQLFFSLILPLSQLFLFSKKPIFSNSQDYPGSECLSWLKFSRLYWKIINYSSIFGWHKIVFLGVSPVLFCLINLTLSANSIYKLYSANIYENIHAW